VHVAASIALVMRLCTRAFDRDKDYCQEAAYMRLGLLTLRLKYILVSPIWMKAWRILC